MRIPIKGVQLTFKILKDSKWQKSEESLKSQKFLPVWLLPGAEGSVPKSQDTALNTESEVSPKEEQEFTAGKVMSAPNTSWKGSRKLVSAAATREQTFNSGISKGTSVELAGDLCGEAKQGWGEELRLEAARSRSCTACSSSCSTLPRAFASIRNLDFVSPLEAGSIHTPLPGGWDALSTENPCPVGKQQLQWNSCSLEYKTHLVLNLPWSDAPFAPVPGWKNRFWASTNFHLLLLEFFYAHKSGAEELCCEQLTADPQFLKPQLSFLLTMKTLAPSASFLSHEIISQLP